MKFNQKLEAKPKMDASETLMKMKNLLLDYVRVTIDEDAFKQWLETLINATSLNTKDFANRLFNKIYLDTFPVSLSPSLNNKKWVDIDLEKKINTINLLIFSTVNNMTEDKKFWFLSGYLDSFSTYWESIWWPLSRTLRSQNYQLNMNRWDTITSTLSKSYWRWAAMLLFWCTNKDKIWEDFKKLWFNIDFKIKQPRQLAQIWLYYKTYLEYLFYNIFDYSKLSPEMLNDMQKSLLLPKSIIPVQPFEDINKLYDFSKMLNDNGILTDTLMRDRGIFGLIKQIKWISSLSKIKIYNRFLWKKTP